MRRRSPRRPRQPRRRVRRTETTNALRRDASASTPDVTNQSGREDLNLLLFHRRSITRDQRKTRRMVESRPDGARRNATQPDGTLGNEQETGKLHGTPRLASPQYYLYFASWAQDVSLCTRPCARMLALAFTSCFPACVRATSHSSFTTSEPTARSSTWRCRWILMSLSTSGERRRASDAKPKRIGRREPQCTPCGLGEHRRAHEARPGIRRDGSETKSVWLLLHREIRTVPLAVHALPGWS